MPVLEGALERAVDLAAAMDSRGYGRTGPMRRSTRLTSVSLLLVGLVGICVGVYALLDAGTPGALGLPLLVLGAAAGGGTAAVPCVNLMCHGLTRLEHRRQSPMPRRAASQH